jgi:hypothetical protein
VLTPPAAAVHACRRLAPASSARWPRCWSAATRSRCSSWCWSRWLLTELAAALGLQAANLLRAHRSHRHRPRAGGPGAAAGSCNARRCGGPGAAAAAPAREGCCCACCSASCKGRGCCQAGAGGVRQPGAGNGEVSTKLLLLLWRPRSPHQNGSLRLHSGFVLCTSLALGRGRSWAVQACAAGHSRSGGRRCRWCVRANVAQVATNVGVGPCSPARVGMPACFCLLLLLDQLPFVTARVSRPQVEEFHTGTSADAMFCRGGRRGRGSTFAHAASCGVLCSTIGARSIISTQCDHLKVAQAQKLKRKRPARRCTAMRAPCCSSSVAPFGARLHLLVRCVRGAVAAVDRDLDACHLNPFEILWLQAGPR